MAGSTMQPTDTFVEKRSYPRRKMLKSVGISYGTEFCSTNAVLRNISGVGGYVDFKDGILVPDNFRIYNEFDGYKVDCAVVRRSGNSAGFMFTGPAETHSNVRKQVVGAASTKAADQPPEIKMQHLEKRLSAEPAAEPARYKVKTRDDGRPAFGKKA